MNEFVGEFPPRSKDKKKEKGKWEERKRGRQSWKGVQQR